MEEQPQRRPVSKGTCSFCGGTFSKGTMARHLAACPKRAAATLAPATGRRSRQKAFHLVVAGRYRPEYWLHLDVPASRTLEDLDDFLRDIWLECCGHLSAFNIAGKHFMCGRYGDFRDLDDEDMDIPLRKVLRPGMSFEHQYDFGSTTELTLRVLSELDGTAADGSIRVLARNQPPLVECQTCGQPATQLCSQCVYDDESWLCDECAAKHECGEEMLLRIAKLDRRSRSGAMLTEGSGIRDQGSGVRDLGKELQPDPRRTHCSLLIARYSVLGTRYSVLVTAPG